MTKFALLGMMLLAAGPVLGQTAAPPAGTQAGAPVQKAANAEPVEAQLDQRISQMHQRLKITAAQQSDWDAFAQVMRDNVTTVDQAYQQRRASIATMSAPDNMRNFALIEQDRATGIQKLAASFQVLYDAMSDEQKKSADAMFRHYEDHAAMHKAPK